MNEHLTAAHIIARRYSLDHRELLGVAWEAVERARPRLDPRRSPHEQRAYLLKAAKGAASREAQKILGLFRDHGGPGCHVELEEIESRRPSPGCDTTPTEMEAMFDRLTRACGMSQLERAALRQRAVEDEGPAEIAATLGVSYRAAAALVARGRAKVAS